MDLAFPAGLVVTILLSVLITGQIASDGRSDWLKGAQLLVVYLVLALAFFFPAWQLAIIREKLCHLAGESLPRSAGAGGDS
jgi:hypothetical protein